MRLYEEWTGARGRRLDHHLGVTQSRAVAAPVEEEDLMNRTFRTFVVTVITEVEYVSGTSEGQDENTLRHLTEDLAKAAGKLSLRSVQGVRVTFSAGGVMPPAA